MSTCIYRKELTQDEMAQIYEEHVSSVFNFLYYKLGNKEVAEDLTSEIFLRVIEKYSYYDEEKGSFKVWIFTIARNMLRDELRKKMKIQLHPLDDFIEMAEDKNSIEDQIVTRTEMQRIIKALPVLNQKARNIISLKYGAGLGNNEIAKVTKLSEKNVGVILCRSIAKLRKEIGDEENGS